MIQLGWLDRGRNILQGPLVHGGILDDDPFREIFRNVPRLVHGPVERAYQAAFAAATRAEDKDVRVARQAKLRGDASSDGRLAPLRRTRWRSGGSRSRGHRRIE